MTGSKFHWGTKTGLVPTGGAAVTTCRYLAADTAGGMNRLLPDSAIARFKFDAVARTVSVTMNDGTVLTDHMRFPVSWDELSSTETDVSTREMTLRLRSGECLVLELGAGGETDLPQPTLPVVYLDQCHWVTLAKHLRSPDRVAKRDREPAERIVELSRSKAIVVPMSSANRWEIAREGRHRRDVVLTMAELSRGWRLRDPISVRGQELRRCMAGEHPARAAGVITLAPGAISSMGHGESMNMRDAPPGWNELFERQTIAMASVAALLENQTPEEGAEGRKVAAAWAKSFGDLAVYMRSAGTPIEHARMNTHARMLADLRSEIAQAAVDAGLSPQRNAAWIESSNEAFESMPYLRTLREVLYHRLRNADDRWTGNDLGDSQYLCCAAAYADFVAAENKFGHYLQRAATRYTDNAVTVTKLPDLVGHLSDAGIA